MVTYFYIEIIDSAYSIPVCVCVYKSWKVYCFFRVVLGKRFLLYIFLGF